MKLLLIGYLYCGYTDKDSHKSDLWFYLNPKGEPYVQKTEVVDLLKDMLHIAVD